MRFPYHFVAPDVGFGKLVRCFNGFERQEAAAYALYPFKPARNSALGITRAFIELIAGGNRHA